jgi:hypothetical protein
MFMQTESVTNVKLIDLRKIWDQAAHNAFTDLQLFRSRWFCVFREGEDHVSPLGKIRVLSSEDGVQWSSAALLEMQRTDLRDPKISIAPSGRLMLNAGAAFHAPSNRKHHSYVWFSNDGFEWREPHEIGEPNCWLWRVTWHRNIAYSIGYTTVEPLTIKLYASRDGIQYDLVADDLRTEDFPNEATLAFQKDDTALCLLRREAGEASALLGISRPPYAKWEWKNLGLRIGGPNLLILPDGRIVAAIRRYHGRVWTSLNFLDPVEGRLREFLALPSGGDSSYAGLCWHEGSLWVSYYSSHELRTNIYLARVQI